MVRARELVQSYELVLRALDALPEGPLAAKIKGVPPKGEAIMRTEQPRGELFEYARGNGTPRLERLRVRTPTFANIPALLATLPGCEIADVPVIVLSIDPCVACLER
jgi:ech hydrogenase subunit E